MKLIGQNKRLYYLRNSSSQNISIFLLYFHKPNSQKAQLKEGKVTLVDAKGFIKGEESWDKELEFFIMGSNPAYSFVLKEFILYYIILIIIILSKPAFAIETLSLIFQRCLIWKKSLKK